MAEIQLGVIEARYADMIWAHEPVTSSELVKMTAVEFNWKRTGKSIFHILSALHGIKFISGNHSSYQSIFIPK
ncbi:MAG: hypothetical protein HDR30_05790 [Lachnospiraceae bacterium]|nr:hypothetical protein [Lachnospiraceae bacterium]